MMMTCEDLFYLRFDDVDYDDHESYDERTLMMLMMLRSHYVLPRTCHTHAGFLFPLKLRMSPWLRTC